MANFGILQPIQGAQGPQEMGQPLMGKAPELSQASLPSGGGDVLGEIGEGLGQLGKLAQAFKKPEAPISTDVSNLIGDRSGNAIVDSIRQSTPNLDPNSKNNPLNINGFNGRGVRLDEINPGLQDKMLGVLTDLQSMGYKPIIIEGARTKEQQAEKVKQGNSKTMNSQHIGGNAVDVVDVRWQWNDKKYGKEIAQYAKDFNDVAAKHGLMTGYGWKSFGPNGDFAHLQFPKKTGPVVNSATTTQNRSQNQAVSNGPADLGAVMAGIAHVESGGSKDPYSLMSKPSKNGDRAYGKYQIMGNNIPSWGKMATGRNVTVEEFRRNPELQEQIATYMISKNLKAGYSPEDTASIWFSGRPQKKAGNAKDVYGTTVPQYVKKFQIGMSQYAGNQQPAEQVVAQNQQQPYVNTYMGANPVQSLGLQPNQEQLAVLPQPGIPKFAPPTQPNDRQRQMYEDIIRRLDQGRDSYSQGNGINFGLLQRLAGPQGIIQ